MRATCSPRSCCSRVTTRRAASYLHARDALLRLVELGVVPVVNENDTVTVDEIKFGDNDTLAALVSCLVSADLCVTLSDIDGLSPPIRMRIRRPSLSRSCIRSMPRLSPRRAILPHRWARAA
ncbi:MAG: hypothetical protein ACLRM9_10450 [Collinsella aerofaciens]